MGVYQRMLKGGYKWRFKGSFRGKFYASPAIYATEGEAQEAEKRYISRLLGDTLEVVLEKRIEYLKVHTTNRDYWVETEQKCRTFLNYVGWSVPVRDVTKAHAQGFIQKVALAAQQGKLSPHQPNHYIRILRALFNHAIDHMEIDMKNPFQKMKLLPVGDKRKYVPTRIEVQTVRGKLKGAERELFDFVDETGCRINEALRLRVEDVRKDTVTLYTRKAKNSNLTPRVVRRPKWLKIRNGRERVFEEFKDYPRFLEEIVPRVDGKVKWGFHNLRHRRASLWASEGVPIFEIMTRLGHNNVATTMIYLHSLGVRVA